MTTWFEETPSTEPQILKEQDQLIVLFKPSGIHSTSQKSADSTTLQWFLSEHLKEQGIGLGDLKEAGLVQRLDYETSGVVLAARAQSYQEALREILHSTASSKLYLALVEGLVDKPFTINGPIAARYRRSKKVTVLAEGESPSGFRGTRAALTVVQPLSAFAELDCTLVAASCCVGQRHQIRAHLASVGHPLVGDDLYGSNQSLLEFTQEVDSLSFPRFILHAESVLTQLPGAEDSRYLFAAPLPVYLKRFGFDLDQLVRARDLHKHCYL